LPSACSHRRHLCLFPNSPLLQPVSAEFFFFSRNLLESISLRGAPSSLMATRFVIPAARKLRWRPLADPYCLKKDALYRGHFSFPADLDFLEHEWIFSPCELSFVLPGDFQAARGPSRAQIPGFEALIFLPPPARTDLLPFPFPVAGRKALSDRGLFPPPL